MPTLTFPQSALRSYLKGNPSDEELQTAISMLGTDLESFGEEIVVEIFPNRPDLLSVPGLARALNTYMELSDSPIYTAQASDYIVRVDSSVKNVRPYTTCAVVSGLRLTDEKIKEIITIQEKLHVTFGRQRKKVAIGIYPLEKITWPISFSAQKPEDIIFRPLDGDAEIDAKKMLKTHPTGQKYAPLLEGGKTYPVFRDANNHVLSVPPIVNSHDVGKVNETTTAVFIECSGHLELPLHQALRMITCALVDMGGKVHSVTVTYPDWEIVTPDFSEHKMSIDKTYLVSRLGIPENELEKSLKKMGIRIEENTAYIPSYRTDFLHQVDVGEDAAIGYGYDNITSSVPDLYTVGSLSKETRLHEEIRKVLAGFSLQEVMTYYLRPEGVELVNALTIDYAALRTELLTSLIDVLAKNNNNMYPQEIFEIGPVFSEDTTSETQVSEKNYLSFLHCLEEASYTKSRQTLEALALAFGWDIEFSQGEDKRFLPGRCARVMGDVSGIIGEIHPLELAKRGIQMPTCGGEISLENIY